MIGVGDLFGDVCCDATLSEAWHRVWSRGAKSPGPDGQTVEQFQRHLYVELRRLQDELRGGTYQPGPVKEITLWKANGGARVVYLPNVRDRVVQRAILHAVGPLLDARFDDASNGYRPRRSVATALDRAVHLVCSADDWAIRFDVQACFENIRQKRLRRDVRHGLPDVRLRRLVLACLAAPRAREGAEQIPFPASYGLAQGFPLSPLFANLYLDRFDRAARKARLRFVRYADDVLIIAGSRSDAEFGFDVCREILDRLGLSPSPGKTDRRPIMSGVVFLGAVLRWDVSRQQVIWHRIPRLAETWQNRPSPPPQRPRRAS